MSGASDRLTEAVEAFDAGNLAWGHFRHETLPKYPFAATVAVERIRQALGDAAIAIVDLQAGESADEFQAALAATLALLDSYRTALPEDVPRDDLDAAFELLSEALAALDGL